MATLRSQLRSGAFGQGQALVIVDLARDLNLSPTPVREALARLAGEGLVEERRGRGYFAWRLDVIDLVELYGLHELYLRGALELLRVRDPLLGDGPSDAPGPDACGLDLLAWTVRLAGSRALMQAQAGLAERLRPIAKVEARLLPDLELEASSLWTPLQARRWPALYRAVRRYHRRRRDAATEIALALRREVGGS